MTPNRKKSASPSITTMNKFCTASVLDQHSNLCKHTGIGMYIVPRPTLDTNTLRTVQAKLLGLTLEGKQEIVEQSVAFLRPLFTVGMSSSFHRKDLAVWHIAQVADGGKTQRLVFRTVHYHDWNLKEKAMYRYARTGNTYNRIVFL